MLRKIFGLLLIGVVLFSGSLYAAKVNLTETGTPWVWRTEDGSDGSFMLMEDGSNMVSELSYRIVPETTDLDHVMLESGDTLLLENGDGVLLESSIIPGGSTMLYRALIGQGYIVTDLPATLPQAIQGTDAALAYDRLLMESGGHLLLENTNTIRLEN